MERVIVSKDHYDHLVRLAESEYGSDPADEDVTIVPENGVVVDRARFERLQDFANQWGALPEAFLTSEEQEDAEARMDAAFKKLEPTDLDPLP